MRAIVDAKIRKQLLPILFIVTMMCELNQTNIAFTAFEISTHLSFPAVVWFVGSRIFFLTFAIFSLPCSLLANKVDLHIGIPAIIVLCGISSSVMAFILEPVEFYIIRFFAAVSQTGLFPTVLYYMSLWFSEQDTGLR